VFCNGFGTLNAKSVVREFAETLRERQVDDGRPCRRSWWHNFKARHSERKAITSHGIENAECEVARQDVLAYFGELKNALTQMRSAAHLFNIDKTGLCSRPEKARKQKIVYVCDCLVKPAFKEQTDPNYISLVARIVFSGDA
jgi:hypothetical protein